MSILLEGEVLRDHKTGAKGTVIGNLGTRRDRKGKMCQKVEVRIYEAKAHYKVGDAVIWSIPMKEDEL